MTRISTRNGLTLLLPLTLALIGWLFIIVNWLDIGLRTASWLVLASTLLAGFCIIKSSKTGQWSLSFLLFLGLALFHVGLFVSPALLGKPPQLLVGRSLYWWFDADMVRVAALVALALLAFAIGVCLPSCIRRDAPLVGSLPGPTTSPSIRVMGSLLTIVGVVSWFVSTITAAGWGFMLASYESYLAAVEETHVGLSFMCVGIGLPLVALDLRGVLPKVAVVFFAVFAVVSFPLGLRGEVLLPLLVAVGCFMLHRETRPRWLLLIASAILLVLVAVVRQLRSAGLEAWRTLERISMSPLDGIEETGSSVRVVAVVVAWHDSGRGYVLGQTYYIPWFRHFQALLGARSPIPGDQDLRLFNTAIKAEFGNIGGSIIGEGYYNFGILGVLVILGLFGFLTALHASRTRSAYSVAMLSIVGMVFAWMIRNASTEVDTWIGLGVLVVVLARFLDRLPRISSRARPISGDQSPPGELVTVPQAGDEARHD